MIDYTCTYEGKTIHSLLEIVETSENYSILSIKNAFYEFKLFLWHSYESYWMAIPEYEISCKLDYPTHETVNFKTIHKVTNDEDLSKTIAQAICGYYQSKKNVVDIEKYISSLNGQINSYKVSVVLYDPLIKMYHLLYLINKEKDECTMLTISSDMTYYNISVPFISQLNMYYDHCDIETSSIYLNKDIEKIRKECSNR